MTLRNPFAGWNAVLAVTEKGDRRPLAEHLRAVARGEVAPDAAALWLAAKIIAPEGKTGPHTSPVQAYLKPVKSLAVAGDVLRLSHGYTRGEVEGAVMQVANEQSIRAGKTLSESWVKGHIKIAMRHMDGQWWDFKVRKFRRK